LLFKKTGAKESMEIIADLHLHSKYSRATSERMTIEELAKFAKVKGLDVLGTGDFTHPKWLKELKSKLVKKDGIYEYDAVKFIPSGEISLIYKQGEKTRRVHNMILAPDFEVVEQINTWLSKKGRLDYDGRPIFGFSCPELVEAMMSISKDVMVIPAHAWTPWYSLFGSMSGFDSVEECFQDQAKHIHALETGLSSDPPMNWRLSSLDKFALVSNSDSHSPYPWRLGREANVFDLKTVNYDSIVNAVKKKDPKRFLYTIEVDPAYGKYHIDGHRSCGISLEPKEAEKLSNLCPKCQQPLTIGVLHRVEELADRPEGFRPKDAIPFKSLIPLHEILSALTGSGVYSKSVNLRVQELIDAVGSELDVLLKADINEVKKKDREVGEVVEAMRKQELEIKPGYDGVYGKILLRKKKKMSLKEFV
jgi:uncharacterized protein (TIGR00375 family)